MHLDQFPSVISLVSNLVLGYEFMVFMKFQNAQIAPNLILLFGLFYISYQ